MNMKRALVVAAVTIGSTLGMAAPSSATQCGSNTFCLYYNSNLQGAWEPFSYGNYPNLAGYTFGKPGNGSGQPVKNNAASASNGFSAVNVRVWYNSFYAGPSDYFAPQVEKNLVNTYNEDASISMAVAG